MLPQSHPPPLPTSDGSLSRNTSERPRRAVPVVLCRMLMPLGSTMMHDAPERLHCFYNKKSTFVHGVEGEEVAPSLGQQVRARAVAPILPRAPRAYPCPPPLPRQAIHQKVLSLGLSNCKAFIHHIDTQPSFQGGILLQVIGEMSNASGPWRKFTQTFFLAEQPNGYYVLNDIFRYLKEDGEDEDEEEEEEEQGEENAADVGPEVTATEPSSATEQSPAPVQAATEPVKVDADILTVAGAPGVSNLADGAAAVKQETAASEPPAAKDEPPAPAPVSQEHQSEAPKAEEAKPEPVVEQSKPAPVPVKQEETSAAAPVKEHKEEKPGAPAAADPSAKSSRPTSTSPAPNAGRRQSPSRAKPSAGPVQPPAAPAAPAAPPKPRTWASTAAAKPAAWGTALATKEALSNPTTAASALPAAKLVQAEKAAPVQQQPQAQAKQQQQQGQQGQGQKYPLVEAAKAVQTAICFVKVSSPPLLPAARAPAADARKPVLDSSTTGKPKTRPSKSPRSSFGAC